MNAYQFLLYEAKSVMKRGSNDRDSGESLSSITMSLFLYERFFYVLKNVLRNKDAHRVVCGISF